MASARRFDKDTSHPHFLLPVRASLVGVAVAGPPTDHSRSGERRSGRAFSHANTISHGGGAATVIRSVCLVERRGRGTA